MTDGKHRSALLPWFIGIAVIAAVDAYIAYLLFATDCAAPTVPRLIVVVILPVVYIALMYLTFKSQNGRSAGP